MINKIEGTRPLGATSSTRRTSKAGATSDPGFSKHLDGSGEVGGPGAATAANPLGQVTGVLGLQEVDDALARASKGKLRAEDLLSHLDDLRLDILSGGISRDRLVQLARIINVRRAEVSDPKLTQILDEIDLRAQVELAKYSTR